MGAMAISNTVVYSIVYPVAGQRKHESSASLAFVRGIHRWHVNSRHKGPVTRKMFPFDDVIMNHTYLETASHAFTKSSVSISQRLVRCVEYQKNLVKHKVHTI